MSSVVPPHPPWPFDPWLGLHFKNKNPAWLRDRFGSSDIRCLSQEMWTIDIERLIVDNPLKMVESENRRVRARIAHDHFPASHHNLYGQGKTRVDRNNDLWPYRGRHEGTKNRRQDRLT